MKLRSNLIALVLLPFLALAGAIAFGKDGPSKASPDKPKVDVSEAPIQVTFDGLKISEKVTCAQVRRALKDYTRDNGSWTKIEYGKKQVAEPGTTDGSDEKACVPKSPQNEGRMAKPSIAQLAGFESPQCLRAFLQDLDPKTSGDCKMGNKRLAPSPAK